MISAPSIPPTIPPIVPPEIPAEDETVEVTVTVARDVELAELPAIFAFVSGDNECATWSASWTNTAEKVTLSDSPATGIPHI
jgi:hypothetical protein